MYMDGKELTEKELLEIAIAELNSVCEVLFESKDYDKQMLAFMVDSCLKLAQVIYREDDPLSAAADYQAYEEMVSERHQRKRYTKSIERRLKEMKE